LILRGGEGLYSGVPLSEKVIARGNRPETRSAGHFPNPSAVEKTSPVRRTRVARFGLSELFGG